MKKILSLALLLALTLMMLVSCGNISESYAKKINNAAEKGEHYTYEEVLEDLGDDAVDATFLKSGLIIAVKGCDSVEDIEEKLEDGKTLKGIVVTVAVGKATFAEYKEINEETLKNFF